MSQQSQVTETFKDLFRDMYLHIEIGDLKDEFFTEFIKIADDTTIDRALDLCQDKIMANGLCPYYE